MFLQKGSKNIVILSTDYTAVPQKHRCSLTRNIWHMHTTKPSVTRGGFCCSRFGHKLAYLICLVSHDFSIFSSFQTELGWQVSTSQSALVASWPWLPVKCLPSHLLTLFSHGMGEKRKKARRKDPDMMTVWWEKQKLCVQARQKEELINSLLPISMQIHSHFLEGRTSARVIVVWENKCYNHHHLPFVLLLLTFYCWAQDLVEWNILMISLGQFWFCIVLSTGRPTSSVHMHI